MQHEQTEWRPRKRRDGQVLVEFALIALVMVILFAFTFDMGRALFSAQVLQQTADLFARELARTPLPPTTTFADALDEERVYKQIFDESLLVVDVTGLTPAEVRERVDAMPVVNRLLWPTMIPDVFDGKSLIRYPGALMQADISDRPFDTGLRVAIPRLRDDDSWEWVDVVEQVVPAAPVDPSDAEPFSLESKSYRGLVAVRFNYPFQAAAMSDSQAGAPVAADDAEIAPGAHPKGWTPARSANDGVGPYSGQYGMGRQIAFPGVNNGQGVRPFRRVLSVQAVQRREVFQKAS